MACRRCEQFRPAARRQVIGEAIDAQGRRSAPTIERDHIARGGMITLLGYGTPTSPHFLANGLGKIALSNYAVESAA